MNSFFRSLIFLLLVAGIVTAGWNEPLRYRTMSRAEIADLENPPVEITKATVPVPKPKTGDWMWDSNRRTKLDGGSYDHRSGVARGAIIYPAYPTPTPYR